eukprot:c17641_g1_i1 orf=225-695(+)
MDGTWSQPDKAHACCHGESNATWGVQESIHEMDFHRSLAGAAKVGDVHRMRELFRKGVKADDDDGSGYTPLHYAARNGHLEACCLLLQHGAKVDKRTRAGKATSLHRAAYAGHQDIVKLLLQAGADIYAKDADCCTPLQKAVMQGHVGVAELLMDM